jgi:ribosomal protein L21E
MTTEKEEELKKELREMLSNYYIGDLKDISIEYDKHFNNHNPMYDGYTAILIIDYISDSNMKTLEQKWHISKIEGVEEALRIWLYHRRASV